MPMPKAAVYENHYLVLGKYEVGPSWQVLRVQPEPEAESVSDLAHAYFG
jgi:hypothetical protein